MSSTVKKMDNIVGVLIGQWAAAYSRVLTALPDIKGVKRRAEVMVLLKEECRMQTKGAEDVAPPPARKNSAKKVGKGRGDEGSEPSTPIVLDAEEEEEGEVKGILPRDPPLSLKFGRVMGPGLKAPRAKAPRVTPFTKAAKGKKKPTLLPPQPATTACSAPKKQVAAAASTAAAAAGKGKKMRLEAQNVASTSTAPPPQQAPERLVVPTITLQDIMDHNPCNPWSVPAAPDMLDLGEYQSVCKLIC